MSEVISFRLCRDNPRESEALAVLRRKQEQGYGIRQVLVEALINLEQDNTDEQITLLAGQLIAAIREANNLVEHMQHNQVVTTSTVEPEHKNALSDGFVMSVKKAAKPGFRAE